MATKNLIEIKKWFESGKYPTAEQFHNAMDSFWHKDEQNIPMQSVENLIDTLDSKASIETIDMLSLRVDESIQKAELVSSKADMFTKDLRDVEELADKIEDDLKAETTARKAADTNITQTLTAKIEGLADKTVKDLATEAAAREAADANITQTLTAKIDELANNGSVTEEEKASWNSKQKYLLSGVGVKIQRDESIEFIYADGTNQVISDFGSYPHIEGSDIYYEETENTNGVSVVFDDTFTDGMTAVISVYGNTPVFFTTNNTTVNTILFMSGYNNVTPTTGQWIDYCIMSIEDKVHINRAAYTTTGD